MAFVSSAILIFPISFFSGSDSILFRIASRIKDDGEQPSVLQASSNLVCSSSGDGRVYVISFTADDGNGGTCSGTVSVEVPTTKKGTAVDSGQNFDSTLPWSFSKIDCLFLHTWVFFLQKYDSDRKKEKKYLILRCSNNS